MDATFRRRLTSPIAQRGLRLLKAGRVSVLAPGSEWRVYSERGSGAYDVRRRGNQWSCSCPRHFTASPCKHVAACQILDGTVPGEPVPAKKRRQTYPQDWPAYELGQREELRLFGELLADLTSSVVDPPLLPGAGGRPPVATRDQLFVSILKVWSGRSGRRAHGFVEDAVDRGYLARAHGRMVVQRFLGRPEMTNVLSRLVTLSALPVAVLEENGVCAPDSTGLQTTSFGAWREAKHGERREHTWLKAHLLVGTGTHAVLSARVTGEKGQDSPQFRPLLEAAVAGGFRFDEVVADRGYLSRENYNVAGRLGLDAWIPFKVNSIGLALGSAEWRARYHLFRSQPDLFLAHYHRRSNVESVISALKRKFGETVRSRTTVSQVNEILCMLVGYNLTVVIHEMFEHRISPRFGAGVDGGATDERSD